MPNIIPQHEVTQQAILQLPERCFIPCSIDPDGDIFVQKNDDIEFPTWVRVDEEKNCIRYFTYISPGDREQGGFTVFDANFLNSNVAGLQFHTHEESDRIWANYQLLYVDGVIDAHVVRMTKRFAGAISYACGLLVERDEQRAGIRLVS